jgi:initiation factor 1A
MPNKKGGKGYKKGKHGGDGEAKLVEWNEEEGQMLGRVLKSLGNRRFRVYCNDNKERLAKLCGSTRKSEWVSEGSIVLIGIRELGTATTTKSEEVCDILTIVDSGVYGKLKKMDGVNILLFSSVEKDDAEERARKKKLQEEGKAEDDDVFDRTNEDDEEGEEEESSDDEGLTGEEKQKKKQAKRELKKKKQDEKIAKGRAVKAAGGRERSDSVDIDAI